MSEENTATMDEVFGEVVKREQITPADLLALVSKACHKANTDDLENGEARDIALRAYHLTKSAVDQAEHKDEIEVESGLLDAIKTDVDGVDAPTLPMSGVMEKLAKRIGETEEADTEPDTSETQKTDDEKKVEKSDDDGEDEADDDLRWSHDLNVEADPDDDWGTDPDFSAVDE